jgi:hypothetical protein
VFHVHAPITNSVTGAPMLPQVSALLFGNVTYSQWQQHSHCT